MNAFLQKISCRLGRHVDAIATASGVETDDGEQVVRIVVHCPACKYTMICIDVAHLSPPPRRFTKRGESLH